MMSAMNDDATGLGNTIAAATSCPLPPSPPRAVSLSQAHKTLARHSALGTSHFCTPLLHSTRDSTARRSRPPLPKWGARPRR